MIPFHERNKGTPATTAGNPSVSHARAVGGQSLHPAQPAQTAPLSPRRSRFVQECVSHIFSRFYPTAWCPSIIQRMPSARTKPRENDVFTLLQVVVISNLGDVSLSHFGLISSHLGLISSHFVSFRLTSSHFGKVGNVAPVLPKRHGMVSQEFSFENATLIDSRLLSFRPLAMWSLSRNCAVARWTWQCMGRHDLLTGAVAEAAPDCATRIGVRVAKPNCQRTK